MKGKEKLVIFGTGDIAQIANYYFDIDSSYEVHAFTVDSQYLTSDEYEGKPLVPFENVQNIYPPSEFRMFIALSYASMNKFREKKFHEALDLGYELVSYISSRCTYLSQYPPGRNCFIFEDNTIQPYVKIADNITLWSGNHIGHHSIIDSHNFVSSHVVISGHCHIESNCFIGVNSTLNHKVTLAKETLIGSGSIISKNTEPKSVWVPARSTKIEKESDQIKL